MRRHPVEKGYGSVFEILDDERITAAALVLLPIVSDILGGVATAIELPQLHRLTVAQYHRLIESGGFDEDADVELIEGLLANMSPRTREHENAIEWLARWLFQSVDLSSYAVRVTSSLTLARSEPEPDLAVIRSGAPRPYHPGTADLLIEVAVSSQQRDLVIKPPLYAAAGVTEYWVVDLISRCAVVHREPGNSGYGSVTEVPAAGRIQGIALPLPQLALEGPFRAAAA